MNRSITPHTVIVETLFLDGLDKVTIESANLIINNVLNFCIDMNGRVRKARGIINALEEDDINCVPRDRFDIQLGPWQAHSMYVMIDLPNPALDYEKYQIIRDVFVREITKRLTTDVRTLKREYAKRAF